MLQIGLNPYGLTYYLGLQGSGTPRANPNGRGLEGFITLAQELNAKTLEIFDWTAAEGSWHDTRHQRRSKHDGPC